MHSFKKAKALRGERRGSNPRQTESQSVTLPAELRPPLNALFNDLACVINKPKTSRNAIVQHQMMTCPKSTSDERCLEFLGQLISRPNLKGED
jgi:hypothetical protein